MQPFESSSDTQARSTGVVSAVALCAMLLLTYPLSATTTTFVTPGVGYVEFTLSPAGAGLPPGLPGSAVAAEDAAEAVGGLSGAPGINPPGARVEDDLYSVAPPPGLNVKNYDDGGTFPGGNGIAPPAGPGFAPPAPGFDLTIRTGGDGTDIDAFAIQSLAGIAMPTSDSLAGGFFVQFSVAPGSGVGSPPGLFPPDVSSEANTGPEAPEQAADIYEAFGAGGPGSPVTPFMGGGNTLVVDESSLGLKPGEDVDDFLVNEPSLVSPAMIDTDGAGGADMPLIFISFTPGAAPAGVASGADVCIVGGMPFAAAPAADPTVVWVPPDLGLLPLDDIDALWIEGAVPFTGIPPFPAILFSLAPGSPSLGPLGATAADILHVTPGVGAPATPPALALTFLDMGLVPTDNVDGLWVTLTGAVSVELSAFSIE